MTQMKRWMACLFLLCLAIGRPVLADDAAGIPALQGRVNDYAAVLGASAGAIEAKLSAQERVTGHQVVVLTVPDLGGRDIESYANEVFHTWKLGRKGVDDGVLIVLAVKERRARIEVGYGLEGALTDLASSRILREDMHPHFAAGDLAGGMEAGVDAVLGALEGQELASPEALPPPQKTSLRDLFSTLLGYLSALLLMALFFWCAVATGGVLSLGYLLIPSTFAFAIWGWPVALGVLLAQLAAVYVIRYRLMLGQASKNQQRALTRSGRWPPRFVDVWLWPGFGDKESKRRKAAESTGGGILGFLLGLLFRGGKGGGSGSSGSGFSGGGGDSGGGGSSDRW